MLVTSPWLILPAAPGGSHLGASVPSSEPSLCFIWSGSGCRWVLCQKFLVTPMGSWAESHPWGDAGEEGGAGKAGSPVQRWGICLSHTGQPSHLRQDFLRWASAGKIKGIAPGPTPAELPAATASLESIRPQSTSC